MIAFNENKPWDAQLAYKLICPLRDSWVTPNHLTSLRLLIGVLACLFMAMGGIVWSTVGALCFVISNFIDHMDGELARLTGKSSRWGHYYDLVSDALVNTLIFIGIGLGQINTDLGIWAFFMGCLAGVSVAAIFHMRNKIEQAIGKTGVRQPNAGGFEVEDVLYVLPLISLANGLQPFLILASIGTPLFASWVLYEFIQLRKSQ